MDDRLKYVPKEHRIEEKIRHNVNDALHGYNILSAEARALREVAIAIGILADKMPEPVKPFHVVHKDRTSIYPDNFADDWDMGYKAACDDINDYLDSMSHPADVHVQALLTILHSKISELREKGCLE